MIFKADSYQRFIENEFTIVDKDRQEVPFVLNRCQQDFIHRLRELNNVLKNRKQGLSSVALGIACTKFIVGENEKCASVSFVQSSAEQQLARAKHFLNSYQRKNGVTIPLKYNSKNELVYEGRRRDGTTYINSLRVGTARSDSFGRGDDFTFLHITEAAFATNLNQLLAGIGEAMVNDSITIIETTANGYNGFKQHWDASERGENGFQNIFYDPYWTYTQEFVDAKRAKLGRLGPQEYPLTAEEAFITSGDPYFDADAMRWYLEQTKDKEPMS